MYRVFVPVTNIYPGGARVHEGILPQLERLGASRVYLCLCTCHASPEEKERQLAALRENLALYRSHGYEVGVWISSLGHGYPLIPGSTDDIAGSPYQRIVGMDGGICADSFCPLDPAFADSLSGWIADMARAGADLIMLDDDYRLSLRYGGHGCCCPRHIEEFSRRVGRPIALEELRELVYSGEGGELRRQWLDLRGESLLSLARHCREQLDRVNPQARLGFCAVHSTWDVDGVDAITLSRAFAGDTRPFLRTIGAPYWSVQQNWGVRLGHAIELTRMQRWWTRQEDMELFSEGDVYPRPRYATPAAYLECFDSALRASGGMDGILKYALDYTSSADYERGYADRALRSRPAHEWIDRHFSGKRDAGVEVANAMRKLAGASLPTPAPQESCYTERLFLPTEHHLLCDNTVPIAYGGDGAVVAFHENGKYLTPEQLSRGAVLDITAALHLAARGVDVGIRSAVPSEHTPTAEYFPDRDEYVQLGALKGFWEVEPAEGATVLSHMVLGSDRFTGAFRYENGEGQRFLIYPFDGYTASADKGPALHSYCRQGQLMDALAWMGRPLPARCEGNPYLYMQVKRSDSAMTVGLWNLYADKVLSPVITLDRPYRRIETFGCSARLEGDRILLDSDIYPYEFAGIEVSDQL